VTDKFLDYLALKHFTVLTDNNSLIHVLTSAKLDATGQRWASALGAYDFDILYRDGVKNADADEMSRYPYHNIIQDETDMIKIENNIVKTICNNMNYIPYIDTSATANINILEATENFGTPYDTNRDAGN
jgi:hypothetical protein